MSAQATPPLKALSIRQPWAWAIVALGKDIENRTWSTKHRGPTLIHAGKGLKRADVDAFLETVDGSPELAARLAAAGGLDEAAIEAMTGGVVGAVEIVGCVQHSPSPWFFGPHGFVLANAKALPFEPCKGALGLFVPEIGDATGTRQAAGIVDRFTTGELPLGAAEARAPRNRTARAKRTAGEQADSITGDLFALDP